MATVFPDTPSSNCSSRRSVHLRCASLLDLTEDKSCAGTPRVWPSCERNTIQISSGLWQFRSTCTRNGVSQIGPGRRLWNVGGATEMFAALKDFRIGGEAEGWNQPSHGTGGGAYLRAVATK